LKSQSSLACGMLLHHDNGMGRSPRRQPLEKVRLSQGLHGWEELIADQMQANALRHGCVKGMCRDCLLHVGPQFLPGISLRDRTTDGLVLMDHKLACNPSRGRSLEGRAGPAKPQASHVQRSVNTLQQVFRDHCARQTAIHAMRKTWVISASNGSPVLPPAFSPAVPRNLQ
jgi:hypothetical protein